MTSTALLIAIVCTVLVLVVIGAVIVKKDSLEQRLGVQLDDLEGRFKDYQKRMSLIEAHAVDYANSLGNDGLTAVAEVRETLAAIYRTITEVGSLLATKDLGAMQEAALLISGRAPAEAKFLSGEAVATAGVLATDWEGRLEELLQQIGSRVSSASLSAAEAGIPKREKRERTLFSLFKAKVYTGKGPYEW